MRDIAPFSRIRSRRLFWVYVCLVFGSLTYLLHHQTHKSRIELEVVVTSNIPYPEVPQEKLNSVESLFSALITVRDQGGHHIPALMHNLNMTRSLMRCLEASNCEPNQLKVVILGSQYFNDELSGFNGGEHIWARSVRIALTNLNYTSLVSMNDHGELEGSTYWMFQLVRRLVKVVIVSPEWVFSCVKVVGCIYSPTENPDGVPIWQLFSYFFWTSPNHPLGSGWTLSPEPYPLEQASYAPNYYLGYSVEPNCLNHPFVPPQERGNRMYVMGKYLEYFSGGSDSAWAVEFYNDAAEINGISFVVGASPNPAIKVKNPGAGSVLPKSIVNYGLMPQKEFMDVLAHSRMLVGVGSPYTSPTPYDALCLGVPFLNAIKNWNRLDPWNRDYWDIQHGLLKLLDPPYVYNVHSGDKEGFLKAIKGAMTNPLTDRYILERMMMSSVEKRVQNLMEADWRSKAEELMKTLNETGTGEVYKL
ncbi:uncharacterized protein EI90DRAFT_3051445 [Cantharellus anzutake]|uniref:uncharacterized protein n=1 Tax=Cantharellus anzutake TaxID=1750568 RepID=UPI001907C596|nr:uncharacterized protein EI90DRAFT_3051445 [Cantharellus anzutake]KAF8334197.1 hypothetical protein EI90DRAFT_3051445 [Cantharellus anzutake]